MPEKLQPQEARQRLADLPGWDLHGDSLRKEFRFDSYLDGLEFATRCGQVAEGMNHHPDLLIQWRKVTVTITTHSAGGLTKLDFDYAGKLA